MQVQRVDWLIGWLCGLLLRDLMQVQRVDWLIVWVAAQGLDAGPAR